MSLLYKISHISKLIDDISTRLDIIVILVWELTRVPSRIVGIDPSSHPNYWGNPEKRLRRVINKLNSEKKSKASRYE